MKKPNPPESQTKSKPTGPLHSEGAEQTAPGPQMGDGPPEPPPPGLDDDKHYQAQKSAHYADVLMQFFVPHQLSVALAAKNEFNIHSIRCYLDRLISEAGNPSDPLQKMLIEQAAYMHLQLSILRCDTIKSQSQDATKILNAACNRLNGELRRTIETIRSMKSPSANHSKPRLKVVKAA